jgi:hypothetical protein
LQLLVCHVVNIQLVHILFVLSQRTQHLPHVSAVILLLDRNGKVTVLLLPAATTAT